MELIKIETHEGRQTVNARELHAFLEVKARFNDWIKNRIEQYGFVENQDFITLTKNLVSGGTSKEYHVTLSMAKELAMVERNEKGKQARQYFIECERIAKDPMALLSDPKRLLELTQVYAKRTLELESKVAEQQPKVDGYDRLTYCDGGLNITNAAKNLQIQPKKLMAFLVQKRWVYQRAGGRNKVAYQDKIQSGYLTHKVFHTERADGTEVLREQVIVTPKGIARLSEIFSQGTLL